MKKLWLISLFCVIVGQAIAEVTLKPRWVEGEKLTYLITAEVSSTTELNGKQTSGISLTSQLSKEVEKIIRDTVILKVTVDTIHGTMRIGAQEQPIPGLDKIQGYGLILSIVNSKVVKEEKGEEPLPLTEQYLKEILASIKKELFLFPKEPLKIGDSWDREYKENGMEVKTCYTLERIEKMEGFRCAKITFISKINIEREETRQGIEMRFIGKGEAEGKIYFAIDKGQVIYQESKSSMEGRSEIPAMERSFNIHTDSHITRKLLTK